AIAGIARTAPRHALDEPGLRQFPQAVLDVGNVVAVAEPAELAHAARLGREHQLLKDHAFLAGELLLCAGGAENRPRKSVKSFRSTNQRLLEFKKRALALGARQRTCGLELLDVAAILS